MFLRYIASGESFRSLEYQFRISRQTISRVISMVAKAIIHKMEDAYLKTLNTVEEWLLISEKLSQYWNFPNMISTVDGKHLILQQPCNSGSHYRNYKGMDSIILMAVVGPEYQFLFAGVGMNRKNSDRGKCLQSPMRKALEKNTLSLPKPKPLHENHKETLFVCVGDDAFPLTNYMMKPYPKKDLTIDNY